MGRIRLTEREARELGLIVPPKKKFQCPPPEPKTPYDPTWYARKMKEIDEELALKAQERGRQIVAEYDQWLLDHPPPLFKRIWKRLTGKQ